MARCAADPRAAGFANDRGFAERHAQPGVAGEWDHARKHHCIRRLHCVRRHTPRASYEQGFGGLNRRFRHAPGRYHLLARAMEQGHHHCHLESFVCPRHFATLSDDGNGMGRTETTYQHRQARRRLRRSGQSIRRTDSRGRGSPPRLRRDEIPGSGRNSGTGNHRRLYLARPSPPYHQCQKGESR